MASKVRFSGGLYQDRHTFQALAEQLEDEAKQAVLDVAEMYRTALIARVEAGESIWGIPDTPYYRRKKEWYQDKHGLPKHRGPWIKTGELVYEHIQVGVREDGTKRFRAWAGFDNREHHSGLKAAELADWLDTRFPLIHPAWEDIKPMALRRLTALGGSTTNFRVRRRG